MINDQLLSQIGLLLKEALPPLIRVTDSPSHPAEAPKWAPGDKLPATVLTSLPNGRFQVQVDNQTLELNLPKNTQPGDQLELVYIGNSPRLTFTLAATPAPLAGAAIAAGLSPAAELSETAHLLGQLTQQGSETAQKVVAQSPVLASPPADPAQLAVALARTLAGSGLFYEAHQAQWVQGTRSLASLLQEPQAQPGEGPLSQDEGLAPQALQTPLAQDQVTQLAPIQPGSQQLQPLPEQPDQMQYTLSLAGDRQGEALPVPVLPTGMHALPASMELKNVALLQQQLQVLNSGAIGWSGPVWPGQQMEWDISRFPAGQAEDGQQWQTRLNLALPGLGQVSAWLLLGQQGLQVRLQAGQESTRQLLAVSGIKLDAALQSAGIPLVQYSVESHG